MNDSKTIKKLYSLVKKNKIPSRGLCYFFIVLPGMCGDCPFHYSLNINCTSISSSTKEESLQSLIKFFPTLLLEES